MAVLMDRWLALKHGERVQKISDFFGVLTRESDRLLILHHGRPIRLAVVDRPPVLIGPDVEPDEAHVGAPHNTPFDHRSDEGARGTRLFTGHDYMPGGREPRWESTVAEQRGKNVHLLRAKDEAEFVVQGRDRTLPMPKLILAGLQVNIAGGRLPLPESR